MLRLSAPRRCRLTVSATLHVSLPKEHDEIHDRGHPDRDAEYPAHALLVRGMVHRIAVRVPSELPHAILQGADAGAGFGAGASGTVFGARGSATFFSKATAVVATLFFVTSLALTYVAGKPAEAPKSIVESAPTAETVEQPEMPAPAGMSLGQDDVPVLDEQAPAPQSEQGN